MEDAQKLLLAQDADTLSFAGIPQAREILESKPLKLKERAAAFAAGAVAVASGGEANVQALQNEGVGAVSEGFIRLALIVHEQDKELQEKLLKYQYGSFLAVIAVIFYQFFVIVRPLSQAQDRTEGELARLREELDACVGHDPLTGLPNRVRLEETMSREVEFVRRYGTTLSAIVMDVDEFRKVNQKLGQLGGDEVLKELADLLAVNLRKADIVHRFSGEKFILLIPHVPEERAAQVAEKLRTLVEGAEFRNGTKLTVSLGVAECRQEEDLEGFLARLDEALELAKAAGMNRVVSAS